MTMLTVSDLTRLLRKGECEVRTHSGEVAPGDIFVALPAPVPAQKLETTEGGERFIPQAVAAGAAYVVAEHRPEDLPDNVRFVPADDTRAALGELAAARYPNSRIPRLIGITGTNGKTTTAYLLEELLTAAGRSVGVIGTVEYRWPGVRRESPLTTPGCLDLHALLDEMAAAGVDDVIMEISSHAIDQNRLAGLQVAGALFTNLTQDHLDYHGNMEAYYAAKARLFRTPADGGLPLAGKAAAVNADDPYGLRILSTLGDAVAFGLDEAASDGLRGRILNQSMHGVRIAMAWNGRSWELDSPLVGYFNVMNLLSAQALALALGMDPEAMRALSGFSGVPGRLERIPNPAGLAVFVDYAHTPDALKKALNALRESGFRRILTVFGCGGDRDRTKRPLMGEAAAANSDVVILTSDNPRTEDPLAIMADIKPGLTACRRLVEEPDRHKAIEIALDLLQPGDALLIAGKGHEPYQIIGTTKYPFSDQSVVRELLGCGQ